MEPFTIGDVVLDAWRSFRRTLWAHVRWNVGFVMFAFLGLVVCTCGTSALVERAAASAEALGVTYVCAGTLAVCFVAWHHGVGLAIAAADLRRDPIDVGARVGEAFSRLPALAAVTIVRTAADLAGALPLGILLGAVGRIPEGGLARTSSLVFASLLYAPWWLAVRSFLGLTAAGVQLEGLSIGAALRRSVDLLAGRRLQAVRLKLAWLAVGLVISTGAYALLVVVVRGLPPSGLRVIGVAFTALVTYLAGLHVLSFDAVIEAAYHARITRRPSRESIAAVFA
jgi:hypothetical protein